MKSSKRTITILFLSISIWIVVACSRVETNPLESGPTPTVHKNPEPTVSPTIDPPTLVPLSPTNKVENGKNFIESESENFGFVFSHPDTWVFGETENRIVLEHEDNYLLTIEVKHVSEDATIGRSGVRAGDLKPVGSISFLGKRLSRDVLSYENQEKAVLYAGAHEIQIGNLSFVLSLDDNNLDISSSVPKLIQTEADLILESFRFNELKRFVSQIINDLNENQQRGHPISEQFFSGIYGVNIDVSIQEAAVSEVMGRYAGDIYGDRDLHITADVAAPLPNHLLQLELENLNPFDWPIEAIVYSQGWGIYQPAEALLYFTKYEGELFWMGAIFSFDGFAKLPEVADKPQPNVVSEWLERNNRFAEKRNSLQIEFDPNASFSINPSGTFALQTFYSDWYDAPDKNRYTLIDMVDGGQTVFESEANLQISASNAVWLNDSEVLVGYFNDQHPEGPDWGPMVHLNIETGKTEVITRFSLPQKPFVTVTGDVVYENRSNLYLWQGIDSPVEKIEAEFVEAPALSSNQQYLIGIGADPKQGSINSRAYWLTDLNTGEETPLLSFDLPAMGGYPTPADWNATSS